MWVYLRGTGAGAARGRSGQEELPHVLDQGRWPRGASARPRSGEVAKRSYPMSRIKAVAERSYPMSKVRGGGQEELPRVQGKEQWLHFDGAAMMRYPMSKVRETQGRR